MKRLTRALAAVAFAVAGATLLAACSPSAPSGPPSIRGVVTEPASSADSAILVVWDEESGVEKAEYDAASIRLAKGGVVLIDGKTAAITDLRAGDVVQAWFTGPVAESYPVQAGASRIEKTGGYEGDLPTPPGLEPQPGQPE